MISERYTDANPNIIRRIRRRGFRGGLPWAVPLTWGNLLSEKVKNMYVLKCAVQNYAWGKIGKDSFVTRFVKDVDEKKPYAELWMGTHPNGESQIIVDGKSIRLTEFLKTCDRSILGNAASMIEDGKCPLLFKVLSIESALSIQLHPTKEVAKELYERELNLKVRHYKDPNHKPECAIALTEFEAMCGFRPYVEIEKFILSIPELNAVLREEGKENVVLQNGKDLKRVFTALLNLDQELVTKTLKTTADRYRQLAKKSTEEELFLRVNGKYSTDRCCYCVYFFRYYKLQPGESVFIQPCEPHAYLFGDIMECMANSDNVIRAGLTPKFVDKATLLRITNFDKIKNHQLQPVTRGKTRVYADKNFEEFQVIEVKVDQKCCFGAVSFFIIVAGSCTFNGEKVAVGSVFLVSASFEVNIEGASDDFLLYVATVNK